MTELILYAIAFMLLFAHAMMASMMYLAVHKNDTLNLQERNHWKLKALIFPAYYWFEYKKFLQR